MLPCQHLADYTGSVFHRADLMSVFAKKAAPIDDRSCHTVIPHRLKIPSECAKINRFKNAISFSNRIQNEKVLER